MQQRNVKCTQIQGKKRLVGWGMPTVNPRESQGKDTNDYKETVKNGKKQIWKLKKPVKKVLKIKKRIGMTDKMKEMEEIHKIWVIRNVGSKKWK